MQVCVTLARAARALACAGALGLAACAVLAAPADSFFRQVEIDYAGGVAQMIAQGFDPNTRDARGRVALSVALQNESLKAAKVLWETPGIQVDLRNQADETPLMLAALKNEADAAAALLARGAAVSKSGWAPLHYAAASGSAVVLKLLLAHGAPVDARTPNGTTPLMMAARYGSEEAVDALLAAGADRGARNEQGLDAESFADGAGRPYLLARLKPPTAAK